MDQSGIKSGFNVNFSSIEIPEYKQNLAYGGAYYNAGSDGKWFDNLLYLYENCSTHSSVINNLQRRICRGYENDKLLIQITLDFLITGAYAVEVRWTPLHKKIYSLRHLDVSKIKIGLINSETDEPSFYYYSLDWNKYNNRKIDIFQPYSVLPNTDDHQLFYYKRYIPSGSDWTIYSKPYYFSSIRSIYTKIEIDKFYSNLVHNNFTANSILSIGTFMDEEKQEKFEKEVKKNFTGSENAGSMIVLYTDNMENKPEIIKFNGEEDDKKYNRLNEDVKNEIYLGHNMPPALAGIMYSGKLGNSTEIPKYEEIYSQFVVEPIRQEILNGYEMLKNNLLVI